jgi:hypothetical protein
VLSDGVGYVKSLVSAGTTYNNLDLRDRLRLLVVSNASALIRWLDPTSSKLDSKVDKSNIFYNNRITWIRDDIRIGRNGDIDRLRRCHFRSPLFLCRT